MGRARWIRGGAPSILPCMLSILCVSSLLAKSASWDESYYLGVGCYLVSHHGSDIAQAFLHLPLSSVIAGLPLLAVDIPEEIWSEPNADRRGQRSVEMRSEDWVLNASRLAMPPIVLALGWAVFQWSRRLFGRWAGSLSLTVFVFSPDIIARARRIAPDMSLTLLTTLSGYRLRRFAEFPERRHSGLRTQIFRRCLLPVDAVTDASSPLSHEGVFGGRLVVFLLLKARNFPPRLASRDHRILRYMDRCADADGRRKYFANRSDLPTPDHSEGRGLRFRVVAGAAG